MILIIMLINIVMYILTGNGKLDIDDLSASYYSVFVRKDYKRIITSGFCHGSILHILFNMMSLYNIGIIIEKMYGSVKFVLIYMAILVLSQILSLIVKHNNMNDNLSSIGASGAIVGLIGLYFVKVFLVYGLSGISSMTPLLFNILMMSLIPGVDFNGHLFGFVVGGLFGFLLR